MGNCCTWPREDDGDSSTDSQSILDADEPIPDSEGSYEGAEYEPVLESEESDDRTAYESEPEYENRYEWWSNRDAGTARSPRPYPLAEALGCDRRLGLAHFQEHDGITIGDPPWFELPLPPTWPPYTAGCFQRLWLKALPATI